MKSKTLPMKILFLTTTYPTKDTVSTGFFLTNITQGLHNRHIDVTIQTLSHTREFAEYTDTYNNHVIQIPYAFLFKPLLKDTGLVNALRKTKLAIFQIIEYFLTQFFYLIRHGNEYDIIHGHWIITGGVLACITKPFHKRKVVVTAHGAEFYFKPNFLIKALMKYCYANADKLIFVSKHLMDKSEEMGIPVPHDKTVVIYNCVDTEKFVPGTKKEDIFTFIVVGRLSQEKRVEDIIKATKEVNSAKEFRVWILGHGPEEHNLKQLTKSLGISNRIHFFGFVPNAQVPNYLSKAHVYLKATIQEGFATTNVEAQSAGLPAISTYGSGNNEIFEENVNALFFEPKNVQELAQKMEYMINYPDKVTEMARVAREKVIKNFSIDIIGQEYENLYNSLINE